MDEIEASHSKDADFLFDLAGIHAQLCHYEKAIELYEKSYELDAKPRFYDALWGVATIYEIQGNLKEALHTWDRIMENLTEEWGYTEGDPIDKVNIQKQRIRDMIQ